MKQLIKITVALSFSLMLRPVSAYQKSPAEVLFTREYREYGMKEYGADGTRLARPLQVLTDFYLVEYRLTATHLTISKVSAAHPPTYTVLTTASLSRMQQQTVRQQLRDANPTLLQQQCRTSLTDDGFYLDVTLSKQAASSRFGWHGNYIPQLVALLKVVNDASPEKYRFYKPNQQEAFINSLPH